MTPEQPASSIRITCPRLKRWFQEKAHLLPSAIGPLLISSNPRRGRSAGKYSWIKRLVWVNRTLTKVIKGRIVLWHEVGHHLTWYHRQWLSAFIERDVISPLEDEEQDEIVANLFALKMCLGTGSHVENAILGNELYLRDMWPMFRRHYAVDATGAVSCKRVRHDIEGCAWSAERVEIAVGLHDGMIEWR